MCLYVRNISSLEGRKLQRIVRTDSDRIKMRRAQVILASAQGSKVPAIAARLYFSEAHVRNIIKAFNAEGFAGLAPKCGVRRPRKFSEEQCSLIIETAICPPDLLGRPFTRWSLEKLRDFLIQQRIIESISLETLRQTLHKAKVKLRRTKTWKECNDPDLASKKTDSALRESARSQRSDRWLRRVRAAGGSSAIGEQLASHRPSRPAAGHLHPQAWRAALAGILRPSLRQAVGLHPCAEAFTRSLGRSEKSAAEVSRTAAHSPDPGQLLTLNRRMVCVAGRNQVFIQSMILGGGRTSRPRIALKRPLRKQFGYSPDVYHEFIRDVCCADPSSCPAWQAFQQRAPSRPMGVGNT